MKSEKEHGFVVRGDGRRIDGPAGWYLPGLVLPDVVAAMYEHDDELISGDSVGF